MTFHKFKLVALSVAIPIVGMSQTLALPAISSPVAQSVCASCSEEDQFRDHLMLVAASSGTQSLKDIRKRLVKKKRVRFSELRRLADSGDSLAAYFIADRIMSMQKERLLTDAALYYSIAAMGGRDYAVRPWLSIMENQTVKHSDKRLEYFENALNEQALKGNIRAIRALAKFYAAGEPFGHDPARAKQWQRRAIETSGDGEAALGLAAAIASKPSLSTDEHDEALSLIAMAERSEDLGVRTAAYNLRLMMSAKSDE